MRRALIVEDDEITARMLCMILEDFGYKVDYFPDGHQAVEAAHNAIVDKTYYKLILCDLMIPNLDGHGTIQKIRELETNANVLEENKSTIFIITSLDDPKNYALGLFKGHVAAYITKPFSRAEIEIELKRLQ